MQCSEIREPGRLNQEMFLLMSHKGWSQNRLAAEAEVSGRTIWNMLYNYTYPRVDTAQRVAEALGTTLEGLYPSRKDAPRLYVWPDGKLRAIPPYARRGAVT